MPPAITVEDLAKRYRIGALKHRRTFREAIMDTVATPLQRLRSFGQSSHRERDSIWALRDVSFDVQPGEVVGIIGPNGAGKSTLLKILSRITDPTEGGAVIDGRVASLLEVGTGFHQELTGRENIHLSGAILGMCRREIRAKFDEIVDFSGVETFIDTPVKRYSSGMQVRLGFAVAAHLEPEILLIDEVLAVGDAEFQRRCLGKMGKVAKGGRTVLFVSHNMEAIRRLCPRTVLIANGRILLDGPSADVVSAYLSGSREESSGLREYDAAEAPGDDFVRLRLVRILNDAGNVATVFDADEGLLVEVEFTVHQPITNFHIYIRVFTKDGLLVLGSADWDDGQSAYDRLVPGRYRAACSIPGELLNRGFYSLTVMGMVPDLRHVFSEEHVLGWEISGVGGVGGPTSEKRPGIVRPRLKWDVQAVAHGALEVSGASQDVRADLLP